ncbi:YezD family protein [Paenibacillus sp. 481]|uniref:YezD family protein n=1 Tax=Paenibacillus sp. 481 TaxID=2835869 RepID=UPI001E622352|nr:YezD family protein [Paenibacillus sp. 481]UHA72380.1 YezD family protein [Paenibacillus sp. 481]
MSQPRQQRAQLQPVQDVTQQAEDQLDPRWLDRITDQLKGLKYGSVFIVVHDSKIVQIDRTERVRYEQEGKRERRDTR